MPRNWRRAPRRVLIAPKRVEVRLNGESLQASEGVSVAAALRAMGVVAWRTNPVTGEPRAAYCGMGVCFECELSIDGVVSRACMAHVTPGMSIETEHMQEQE